MLTQCEEALKRRREHLTNNGLFTADDTLLCSKCHEATHFNVEKHCPCGGSLEPFEYFDWFPEAETAEATHIVARQ